MVLFIYSLLCACAICSKMSLPKIWRAQAMPVIHCHCQNRLGSIAMDCFDDKSTIYIVSERAGARPSWSNGRCPGPILP